MKILVVLAHPVSSSFNHSIFQVVCEQLTQNGNEIETLDLYQENFEARMSSNERINYMENNHSGTVDKYIKQLQWAEALIMVYPTWWMGPPAILKGWFDRIWLPSVVVEFGPEGIRPKLVNIKKIQVITTHGASKWRMTLIGNPPRKMMKFSLKAVTKCKNIDWLALYSMDKISTSELSQFLDKVREKIKHF
ncbi:MAG: NAD(P)H-dependent oxidoreductase [Endozoicomonas sp.]